MATAVKKLNDFYQGRRRSEAARCYLSTVKAAANTNAVGRETSPFAAAQAKFARQRRRIVSINPKVAQKDPRCTTSYDAASKSSYNASHNT